MAQDLVRVVFPLDASHWHGQASEALWAAPVGPGLYRLDNSPFFARGVSLGDVVHARPDRGGRLLFDGVAGRAGHSTYRLMLSQPCEAADWTSQWEALAVLGCTYEGHEARLFSVDVPPTSDIVRVYSELEAGVRRGAWDFEEGHCGHVAG